jgi:hypothetical protein
MNKYIIHVETNWCGEDNDFAAVAESEEELYNIVDQLALDNFNSYNGFDQMMEDEFGSPDEEEDGNYTDIQIDWGYENESNYYSSTIELVETDDDLEFFNFLVKSADLVYGKIKEESYL